MYATFLFIPHYLRLFELLLRLVRCCVWLGPFRG